MNKRSSWEIQKAVVTSLFLRELKTRFGKQKFGYFWAIVEPAAIIVVFWVMFGFSMRKSTTGIDFPMFLMTGMVPFQLFSKIVNRSMVSFQANRGLFNYRQVKPIDTIIARVLVECLVYFIVFNIFILIGFLLGFNARVDNILGLLFIMIELIFFSSGFGLICAAIGHFSETFIKVIGLIMRPLFFCSGIYFTVEIVPEQFRSLLLINPLLHFLEKIRSVYFESFYSPYASDTYILLWTVSLTIISLWLYTKLQNKIIAS
ncbi:MAG: ABC transporter permease [Desulfobacterales bacterium]|nr:ABC transporter permease [Desulfobacterales bacterium]